MGATVKVGDPFSKGVPFLFTIGVAFAGAVRFDVAGCINLVERIEYIRWGNAICIKIRPFGCGYAALGYTPETRFADSSVEVVAGNLCSLEVPTKYAESGRAVFT